MIGMDVSSDMVELGKYMYKDKDLELIVNDCSAEQPRFKESFDFISGTFLFQNARNPDHLRNFVRNVYSMMKPNSRYFGLEFNQAHNMTDSVLVNREKIINYKNGVLCEGYTEF